MLRTLDGSFKSDLILGKNKVEMGKRGDYEHKSVTCCRFQWKGS